MDIKYTVIAGFRNAQCSFAGCGGYDAAQKWEVQRLTDLVIGRLAKGDVQGAGVVIDDALSSCLMMGEILDRVFDELGVTTMDEMWELT